VEHLTLRAGLSALESRYGTFVNVPFYSVNPAGGLNQFAGNASGKQTVFSPKWVGTLAAEYTIPTRVGDFPISATASGNSGFFFDPQNRLSSGSYTLLNSSVGWRTRAGGLEVQLWGRNLLNREYYAFIAPSTLGDEYYPSPPRTYGLTVRYRYN
jgi:iron complex outermembrane recepter protein